MSNESGLVFACVLDGQGGGVPGTDNNSAFWVLCGLMLVLAAGQWWLFKHERWL